MSRPVKQQHFDPTEERGILLIKQRIADWAWIYRDQRQSDVGIDGHIEPVDEGATAMECHELEEDTTKTADDCEAMRADCKAACAADTDA